MWKVQAMKRRYRLRPWVGVAVGVVLLHPTTPLAAGDPRAGAGLA
jgi:hypothetical protein